LAFFCLWTLTTALNFQCEGEVGVNEVCTYKGLTFVLSGVGTQGARSEDFITQSFQKYGGRWRVCAWHKNQRDMQLGGKSDEVGWSAYETCRMNGAIVQTGHEHSYSRSYTMKHFETKNVVSTSNDASVGFNESFVFVSGVAGIGVRVCQGGRENNPWWAAAFCDGLGPGLLDGGLICKYNYNGQADKAYCYFKQKNGVVIDSFMVTSSVPAYSYTPPPPASCNQIYQIVASADDAEQPAGGGAVNCGSSDLELTEDGAQQEIGLRFPGVNIDSSNVGRITRARLQFTNDGSEATVHTDPTNLVLQAHDTDDSATFCGAYDIISRAKTTASVAWSNLPTWTGDNHYFSPDVTSVIQEIVARPGWSAGNAMTFIVSGTGRRVANSYGNGCQPQLYIEMSCPPTTTTGVPTTTGVFTTTGITTTGPGSPAVLRVSSSDRLAATLLILGAMILSAFM
jgi:hypothetical protein